MRLANEVFPRRFGLSIITSACIILQGCAGISPQSISDTALSTVNIELPSIQNSSMKWQDSHYLAEDAAPWWKQFDDPVLHQLVEVTLENSKDIGLAIARLDEVMGTARVSRSALLPSVSLDASAGVSSPDLSSGGLQSNSARVNTLSADFVLNWQTDLFGQLRNTSAADKASLQAEASRVRDTQRLIVAQAVDSYYRLVSIRERVRLTSTSVERRAENVERIDQLLIQGYSTALDKTRADNQLYEARALQAQLELDEITLLNQLALLTGTDGPRVRLLLATTGELIVPPETAPLPSISLLIQHRPDLRAVERDLYAAAYRVNSSTAALYPTLGFRLDVGKGVDEALLGSFPALDVLTGGVLANIAMPIIGRGRLLAAIDVSSARLQQAHQRFESTALRVVTELDTSIASMDKNRIIYEQRLLAAKSSEMAADLSKELFKSGELDYTSVILAEQSLVAAETSAITAQQSLLIAYLNYLSAVAPAW